MRSRGVILIIVLIVVAALAFSAYAFSGLMLSHNESAQQGGRQVQAESLMASGVEAARAFLTQDVSTQTAAGGSYDNATQFCAVNVVSDDDPVERGNFTVLSPSLDTDGNPSGVRYGLENESARLNLNALLTLEKQAQALTQSSTATGANASPSGGSAASGGSSTGGSSSGTKSSSASGQSGSSSGRSSSAGSSGSTTGRSSSSGSTGSSGSTSGRTSSAGQTASSSSAGQSGTTSTQQDIPRTLLMALPNMTTEIADAILDWIDTDDQPRENGAEAEYYSGLSPPYAPKNGPLDSVEELLLVRGVTPALLFGQDTNRNGLIEARESSNAATSGSVSSDAGSQRGWAAYLTLYSQERLLNSRGTPKINLNTDDLSTLADSLSQVFSDEWVTFIIAYRQAGPYTAPQPGAAGTTPAGSAQSGASGAAIPGSGQTGTGAAIGSGTSGGSRTSGSGVSGSGASSSRSASGSGSASGAAGSRSSGSGSTSGSSGSSSGSRVSGSATAGGSTTGSRTSGGSSTGGSSTQQAAGQTGLGPTTGQLDLTKSGSVKLTQVLDLIGKQVQVTFQGARQPTILTSPFTNQAAAMQQYLPTLMDEVTVASGTSIVGRINVNQAPRQLLAGIPGLRSDVVDQIVRTRDPQNSSNQLQRQNETWLLIEGLVTLDEMRQLTPFLCAGGDVYRAQVVGYFESGNPAARAEVVLSALQSPPRILLWRNMTYLGRGYGLDLLGSGQAVSQGAGQ